MKNLILILILISTFQAYSKENEVKRKSPTTAMLFAIIPGGGQVYNEQYWKAGIVFGGLAGLGASVYYWNDQYIATQDRIDLAGEDISSAELDLLKRRREFYRDYRDQMMVYTFGVYLASVIDAYVGAHLYTFDTGEDLSMNFGMIRPGLSGVTFKLEF